MYDGMWHQYDKISYSCMFTIWIDTKWISVIILQLKMDFNIILQLKMITGLSTFFNTINKSELSSNRYVTQFLWCWSYTFYCLSFSVFICNNAIMLCHSIACYIIHPQANAGNPYDCTEYRRYGNASKLNYFSDISQVVLYQQSCSRNCVSWYS